MQVVLVIGEHRNQGMNSYRTVLEGYWELEARTGTVGKLQVSTFLFSEYLLSKTKISPLKFDKTVRICSQNE